MQHRRGLLLGDLADGNGHGNGYPGLDLVVIRVIEGDVHGLHALDLCEVVSHAFADVGQCVGVPNALDLHGRALGESALVRHHRYGDAGDAGREVHGGIGYRRGGCVALPGLGLGCGLLHRRVGLFDFSPVFGFLTLGVFGLADGRFALGVLGHGHGFVALVGVLGGLGVGFTRARVLLGLAAGFARVGVLGGFGAGFALAGVLGGFAAGFARVGVLAGFAAGFARVGVLGGFAAGFALAGVLGGFAAGFARVNNIG